MWLIVGLGNPGPKYRDTRHNVGFRAVERLASRASGSAFKEKFKGVWCKAAVAGRDVVLLEPLTFMNLSGESVQAAMAFFKTPLAEVLVIHDELDLALGDVRVKVGGGAAGHNGLKSIVQHCGGPDFARVRIGIGRPPKGSTESWVLGAFDSVESAALDDVLQQAALAAEMVVKDGPQAAQNKFNVRAAAAPSERK
ncbi:MAG: aminoacyl-tRNA hydrolase [Myxococcota bacterium]|nr:aminoacyl-tRNA hydrolase [Myxococcota bacterium]